MTFNTGFGHPSNSPETEALQEFDDFLYMVSHDFKAAFRGLVDVPTWIKEDMEAAQIDLPTSVKNDLDLLVKGAKELADMLDGLTELSRVGRKGGPVLSFRVSDMCTAQWEDLSFSNGATLDLSEAMGKVVAPIDDLARLFRCLLENVLRHSERATVTAKIETQRRADRLHVRLEDDGVGIAPHHRGIALTPLKSLKTKAEAQGPGLGLAIAKRVVERNGGQLTLEDPKDLGGCSVRFDLPCPESESA